MVVSGWFIVRKKMNSEEKFGFEKLRVYQDSLNFSKEIYK
jgi:hypothetical protein